MKENRGAEVTVITLGPPRAENALRTALAIGTDRAILIHNDILLLSMSIPTSKIVWSIHQGS